MMDEHRVTRYPEYQYDPDAPLPSHDDTYRRAVTRLATIRKLNHRDATLAYHMLPASEKEAMLDHARATTPKWGRKRAP
jgi:hypothetical protein